MNVFYLQEESSSICSQKIIRLTSGLASSDVAVFRCLISCSRIWRAWHATLIFRADHLNIFLYYQLFLGSFGGSAKNKAFEAISASIFSLSLLAKCRSQPLSSFSSVRPEWTVEPKIQLQCWRCVTCGCVHRTCSQWQQRWSSPSLWWLLQFYVILDVKNHTENHLMLQSAFTKLCPLTY